MAQLKQGKKVMKPGDIIHDDGISQTRIGPDIGNMQRGTVQVQIKGSRKYARRYIKPPANWEDGLLLTTITSEAAPTNHPGNPSVWLEGFVNNPYWWPGAYYGSAAPTNGVAGVPKYSMAVATSSRTIEGEHKIDIQIKNTVDAEVPPESLLQEGISLYEIFAPGEYKLYHNLGKWDTYVYGENDGSFPIGGWRWFLPNTPGGYRFWPGNTYGFYVQDTLGQPAGIPIWGRREGDWGPLENRKASSFGLTWVK